MNGSDLIAYLRLLAYAALALMTGLVIPVYHRSFSLTWRVLGLFFVAGCVSLILRLYVSPAAYLWWGENVLTPITLIAAFVALLNVGLVSAWHGPHKK